MEMVFKFVLETTTHNFMNWLASQIDLPSHGFGLERQEKYYKVQYFVDGHIIPPSSDWPHPCYVAYGYVATFKTGGGPDVKPVKKPQFDELHIDLDSAEEVEEIGPVVRIEAREMSENRTEVLGWCEDHAYLRASLEILQRVIPEVFVLAGYESMRFPPAIGDSRYELNGSGSPGVEKPEGKMWTDTSVKLDLLRELRREPLRRGLPIPTKTATCHRASIDPKTAKKHAPELWERWSDKDYDIHR